MVQGTEMGSPNANADESLQYDLNLIDSVKNPQ